MQHQYWVTKKTVLRRLGGKEDACIVASDAELDAKLELFKCITESCAHLQRVLDLYQERLCALAQEENALGRYLKEGGRGERSAAAGQLMAAAGRALAYVGHQRLAVRPPLVRLHHEVDTFRARAVTDTRATLAEMERTRTEYRAALSWMKAASAELDPDTGRGLERFRKAQAYVKATKATFDRYKLACLQKIDLLAAARCNMFSHALIPYQAALLAFGTKAAETLNQAGAKLDAAQPFELSSTTELSLTSSDKIKNTFFNSDYTDEKVTKAEIGGDEKVVENLLGEDFGVEEAEAEVPSSSSLLDLNGGDFLGDFMPSKLLQGNIDLSELEASWMSVRKEENGKLEKVDEGGKGESVAWLSLFAELDPLLNQDLVNSGDRA